MYIGFDVHTYMLHIFGKTYFDDPIHVFRVLVLTKPILDFMSKT